MISVVVATRNSSKTITQCLASVCAPKEIGQVIVVDGSSKDGTVELAQKFNVETYHEKRKGFFGAYNIGYEKCNGEHIMFLDSDAYLKDFDFSEALSLFDDPKVALVVCLAYAPVTNWVSKLVNDIWNYRNSKVSKYTKPQALTWTDRQVSRFFMSKNLGSGATPTGPCWILRKSAIDKMGGINPRGDDFMLGKILAGMGYEMRFFTSTSVFHYPRTTLDSLCREYARFGLRGGQIAMNFYTRKERAAYLPMSALSFAAGVLIAKNSKDPRHLLLVPLLRYIQAMAFLIANLFLEPIPNIDYNV